MYIYDDFDRTLVDEARPRIPRPSHSSLVRGADGRGIQAAAIDVTGSICRLHAYMLRIAIPYGTLSSDQIACSRTWRGATTAITAISPRARNIQFNLDQARGSCPTRWPISRAGLHGMQTSGNCVRNITTDKWRGGSRRTRSRIRAYGRSLLRQHLTLHPEFSFLPRKFKIALTASAHDRAAVKIHDIGLHMHRNGVGETGFEVMVGGGLGRTPFLGKTIQPFLPKRDLLSYVEAIMRTYNQYGRRDNIYKARIKILVHELGAEKFAREFEEEWPVDQGRRAGARPDGGRRYRGAISLSRLRGPRGQPPPNWHRRARTTASAFGSTIPSPTTSSRLCHRDALAQARGRAARRCHRAANGRHRRSRRALQFRRDSRVGHEQNLAAAARCPAWTFRRCGARSRKSGSPRQRQSDLRHHRLPRPRLLQPGQRALDPGGRGDLAPFQGPRFGPQSRTAAHQYLRLHQCLRVTITSGTSASSGSRRTARNTNQVTIGGRADENAELGKILGPAVPYGEIADVVEDFAAAYLELR